MAKDIELTAPAGSYEALMAAIKAGADSVYFGVEQLNMRAKSACNFTLNDLKRIATLCQENRIKSYLAVNTILYDEDLSLMKNICDAAKKFNVTAIIASDIAAIKYANSIGLEVHISTQANVSNFEAVKFYSQFADVIVLARELTLEQIKKIILEIKKKKIKGPKGKLIRIELFAHGALCVSIAGKCYMSLANYNLSANRGACLQSCRRAYRVIDDETGNELKIENKYVMSPKDLCTIKFLDKILDAGVEVLKIEGRARSPEYVYTTVKVYREAVESYLSGEHKWKHNQKNCQKNRQAKINAWIRELEAVYNRGFWHGGYYLGKELGEWSGGYGSKATKRKEQLGIVKNYFARKGIGLFYLESGKLKIGDEILITGPTTGVVKAVIKSIFLKDKAVASAKRGDLIAIPITEKVRPNDKLFLVADNQINSVYHQVMKDRSNAY